MTAITFDTLELTGLLRQSGIEAKQAESIVKSIAKAQDGLVTKEYFDYKLDLKFEQEFAPMRTDIAVLKWTLGILTAGIVSIVVKIYV